MYMDDILNIPDIYCICVCDDFASDIKSSNISMFTCTQIAHLLSDWWLNRTEKSLCKHLIDPTEFNQNEIDWIGRSGVEFK